MELKWAELEEFPKYAVSNQGDVINMQSQGPINPRPNQYGHIRVGLLKPDGKQYTRSLAHLVSQHFVPNENPERFDTPIHLDGNLANCCASNLRWRPRWFAIAFHKQFYRDTFHQHQYPIEDVATGERYESPAAACMANGILFNDIILSFTNPSYCFPTYQQFSHVT